LIVNILAPDRYEVSNRPNVTIPTNIRVQNEVRDNFPSFYEALFARVLEKNPKAVVTEYAWTWNGCDPCPPSAMTLNGQDLATLGADVTQPAAVSSSGGSGGASAKGGASAPPSGINAFGINYTLTRLHYRYASADLSDDLLFERAEPLMGGRGIPDNQGQLSMEVSDSGSLNNFQGRYVILHPWSDKLLCEAPQRGSWGGPPSGAATATMQSAPNTALTGAAPKAGVLPALIAQPLMALDVVPDKPSDPLTGAPAASGGDSSVANVDAGSKPAAVAGGGCNCSLASRSPARPGQGTAALALIGLGVLLWRSRRRQAPGS
jgi:MYXO-CTERM domain-containing protein